VPKPQEKPHSGGDNGYLRIGDVAGLVGMSPSALRTWEKLGIGVPVRSRSRYRLYTQEDVRLLKRARFLRRVRGLNARAIVGQLRQRGMLPLRRARNQNGAESLGRRLRRLRIQRRLSLSSVAAAVGISAGFLSALERSQVSASVATLRKLARFYGLNILDFFGGADSHRPLVRPLERKRLQAGSGVRMELLAWGDKMMEPHLFRVAPGSGSGESYTHEGEEFLYVLQGKLRITLEDKDYLLRAGDSFYFESRTPHRWTNPSRQQALILWINTPPTF
jgi:DNA-binding transcriptional MerR regulator